MIKVTALTSLPALFPFYFMYQQWLSAVKNCHTCLEWMNLGSVCPFRCFLSLKHFFPPCLDDLLFSARLAWTLFVLEPPCDSSISSLFPSHFLQCSSFSVLSIASAEVPRRNRSFIKHQISKKLKLGLNNELKSSTAFQETFAVTFSNVTWDTVVIWGCRPLC